MSNQSYKELSIPHFKEVFDILDEVLTRLEIPYYLVGVSAIALKLLEEGIKPSRGTKDIDFAIMVSSRKEFDAVMDAMVARGFNKVESPWTLYHPILKTVIDLLPFGQIEQNQRAGFHQRKVDLHVLGFKEVLESPEKVAIEDKLIRIPPLAGMVLLKLIAWSDRPEIRSTDLYDILTIIQHYFDLNYDEILEHHYDIFPEDDFDQLKIASRVLGRHARKFLNKSELIKTRILRVLDQNINKRESSPIARDWALRKDWDIQYAIDILKELRLGLGEDDQ